MGRIDELRQALANGQTIKGTVAQLRPFGAFVDLGGIDGMIHVSELGHTRVEDPSEVLSVGQQVEVAILRIDEPEKQGRSPRIALSLKALQGDPWDQVADKYPAGSKLSGTVVRLQPFGAFVEIAPGLEGLVHISEMATRRIAHPRDVTEVGARVAVTVLAVDTSQKRISLSMSAADKASAAAEEQANIRDNAPRSPSSLGTMADLFKNVKLK
ncbi:MAG: S1 RNA-binding domain-containing protein [Deltaproteobacteria bacterium]|nr:S1 RNA-binding domain-containing protein [Deltaproteobacteria bacterium]